MKKLTTLILCLLLAPIVVARPSLSGIDSKLDQLLARGAVDPAQIVALQSAGISDDPTCRVTYVRLTDDGGASEPFVVPPNQTLLLGDAYIRALSAPVAAGTTMTFQIKQSLPGSVDGRLLISTTSAPTPSPTVLRLATRSY